MKVDPGNMLVCLPYWDGDWDQMRETATLISDLLPEKQENCDLLFVSRFDAHGPDAKTVMHCMEKFATVQHHRCRRRGIGFPMGCNEMAFEIFHQVSYHHARLFPKARCILVVESDCVMLCRDWSKQLFTAWRKAEAADKLICGNLIPGCVGEGKHHVNAVSMFHWDIVSKIPQLIGSPGQQGWDFYHGCRTAPVAVDTPLIFMDYQKKTISSKELFSPKKRGQVPVLYHGVKDDSAVKAVRKKFSI
ncbi:MAG: hypothetical protein M0Q93_00230 [Terrimicrobiaceae bacterium]|nr:hypothetical protein [Terrimicrobiaceae bacterium]